MPQPASVAKLLGDGCFRSAMRESIGRKEDFADALAAAPFGDGLREHARRQAGLHEFAVGDNASACGDRIVILRGGAIVCSGPQSDTVKIPTFQAR